MAKKRADILLVEKRLAENVREATAMLMAGEVIINHQKITTPGTMIDVTARINVKSKIPYVSRGGFKLAAALDAFNVNPSNKICADVGASTGGFTDVLLQRGAKKVYAIDVGYGDLAWKIRQDPRVVVMERTNARKVERLPDKVALVVVDASFISLKLILPTATKWVEPKAAFITLVKPQFEAKKELVEKGGVVRKKSIHAVVLKNIIAWCHTHQLTVVNLIVSPIVGPAGNKEFLLYSVFETSKQIVPDSDLVDRCLQPLDYS